VVSRSEEQGRSGRNDPEPIRPEPEKLQFGFGYHRVGSTHRWRPSGSTLRRRSSDQVWTGPAVFLAFQTDRIIWIDVLTEAEASQDINVVSSACEAKADAEFRRLFPDAELADPE
jgi:hypothetical protein